MLRVDSRKGMSVLKELLLRPNEKVRVICRIFLPDGSEEKAPSDENSDFELLVRSCLSELSKLDSVASDSLVAWLSVSPAVPAGLQRLVLGALCQESTAEPEELDFLKIVCLLR